MSTPTVCETQGSALEEVQEFREPREHRAFYHCGSVVHAEPARELWMGLDAYVPADALRRQLITCVEGEAEDVHDRSSTVGLSRHEALLACHAASSYPSEPAMASPRKRPLYSGILATPMKVGVLSGLEANVPPPEWKWMGYEDATWPSALHKAKVERDQGQLLRLEALAAEFGVNLGQPGCWMDLALSLAHRHERATLVPGTHPNRMTWAALCARYNVDPDAHDAAESLVGFLAIKHVPGFSADHSRDWGTRYANTDIIRLLAAVGRTREHLESLRKTPTLRAIVRLLLDRKRLRQVMPETADGLHQMLVRWGNASKGSPRIVSERTLRELLYTFRDLFSEPWAGKERSNLELQLASSTMPLLQRLRQ